jgi:hypothetical protein
MSCPPLRRPPEPRSLKRPRADHMTCRPITRLSTPVQGLHTAPVALGAVTVALADSPTAQPRRARSESDIETSFAEADSPTTQARRAYPESSTENTSAETPADSAIPPATSARPESSTESALAEVLAEVLQVERV